MYLAELPAGLQLPPGGPEPGLPPGAALPEAGLPRLPAAPGLPALAANQVRPPIHHTPPQQGQILVFKKEIYIF